MKLAGTARLHEQWILIPIKLDIQLIDASLRPIGTTCNVLLVFDRGSQSPIDFWPSQKTPRNVDAGLALYQSIFHPGRLELPLRGIPEQVLVPAELAKGGIAALERAARCLMAQIEIVQDMKQVLAALPQIRQIIAELQDVYTPARLTGRRRALKRQMTLHDAEQQISAWIYQRCFATHRKEPVLRRLRMGG